MRHSLCLKNDIWWNRGSIGTHSLNDGDHFSFTTLDQSRTLLVSIHNRFDGASTSQLNPLLVGIVNVLWRYIVFLARVQITKSHVRVMSGTHLDQLLENFEESCNSNGIERARPRFFEGRSLLYLELWVSPQILVRPINSNLCTRDLLVSKQENLVTLNKINWLNIRRHTP